MANAAQDRLFEIFVEIAGDQVSNLSTMVDTSQQLAGSLSEVVQQINLTKSSAAQPAAQSTTPGGDAGGSGPLGVVENIASTVLQNVFGAVPLVKGILSLFGGGDSPAAEAPLQKYVLPPSISFQAAETEAGFTAVDFDQTGQARAFNTGGTTQAGALGAPPVPQGGPQITVNVQAMDARSFLDRSSEIAAAVRDAMLNLNSINDVVNDL